MSLSAIKWHDPTQSHKNRAHKRMDEYKRAKSICEEMKHQDKELHHNFTLSTGCFHYITVNDGAGDFPLRAFHRCLPFHFGGLFFCLAHRCQTENPFWNDEKRIRKVQKSTERKMFGFPREKAVHLSESERWIFRPRFWFLPVVYTVENCLSFEINEGECGSNNKRKLVDWNKWRKKIIWRGKMIEFHFLISQNKSRRNWLIRGWRWETVSSRDLKLSLRE